MLKRVIKRTFRSLGLEVSKRDRLVEQIPPFFEKSAYLPRVYRQEVERILYFHDMLGRVSALAGDIVECGVSAGYGLLYFCLLNEIAGGTREFHGFDSFEGLPDPSAPDEGRLAAGDYAASAGLVLRVLRDGRVKNLASVHLHRGLFHETLPDYKGTIALLHLDCDFYDSYRTCLTNLYDHVSSGGLILFDEYQADFPGAVRAIEQFFEDKPEVIERHPQFGKGFIVKK